MRSALLPKKSAALSILVPPLVCVALSCAREEYQPRYIPLRWIELHAPRHPECKRPDGSSFTGPIAARAPTNAWRSSDWLNWMIARMNTVYTGTGIHFWLQSHEVYCTELVAKFLRDGQGNPVPEQLNSTFLGSDVKGDINMLFPHVGLGDLGLSESLRRERWLQRAFALYGDPHGMVVYVHSDYETGTKPLPYADTDSVRQNDFVLPQHGYFPWNSPGLAFIFLSGITWAPDWQFDPELTVAHELGHAFGNLHTLDFESVIGHRYFPDRSSFTLADFWDLVYVRNGTGIQGFANRSQARHWILYNDTAQVHRIDERWNIILDKSSGRMSVRLVYDPSLSFWSETLVPTVDSDSVRLLRGLSFDFDYARYDPPHRPSHLYSWQRNIMSYRYPEVFNPPNRRDAVDPYDYLTARFSRSQIEVMHKQLQGSTVFAATDYGTIPVGKESHFASRFHLLGDGKTEDFVWYSNGEGPANVMPGMDMKDMIAFRAAPAGTVGLESNSQLVAGDFNGDGLADLLWYDKQGLKRFLWSRVEPQDGVHRWDEQFLRVSPNLSSNLSAVFAGDFDGNGADDLFLARLGTAEESIFYFRQDASCRNYSACLLKTVQMQVQEITGPVAVGDFDGRNGDDLVWASYSKPATDAQIFWSNADGSLSSGGSIKVGNAEFVPYAGDFNGTAGDDVLWYNPGAVAEIIWWGAAGGPGNEHRMMCGPGGSSSCIDTGWNVTSRSARVTSGDFDGNGADDIMIHGSDEPRIFFSSQGSHLSYTGHYTLLQVALRNSDAYLTAVGEFDNAIDGAGRLGDDIFLYYRPVYKKVRPRWLE